MKKEMRKPTYSEIYMYKNLLWLAFAVFIFMTVVNELVIRVVYVYAVTDAAYRPYAVIIKTVREALSVLCNYVGLALLSVCVAYFGDNAKGVVRTAFISNAVYLVAYFLAYYISTGYMFESLILSVSEAAINCAVMLAIWIILRIYTSKKECHMNIERYVFGSPMLRHVYTGCFIISASVFGGTQLLLTLADMLRDFLDPAIGTPINIEETLYWVLEYAEIILYAALGFALMVVIGLFAQRIKDSGKVKFSK
ncbi:MAG: hypothetical protein IKB51_04835 [Clostridia bacterium]|nr:hypothetical protein [Clostridia bacterium]